MTEPTMRVSSEVDGETTSSGCNLTEFLAFDNAGDVVVKIPPSKVEEIIQYNITSEIVMQTQSTNQEQRIILPRASKLVSKSPSFPCNLCKKTFNRKSKLILHMRTHTGEKPYGCSVCFRKFSQKNDMVRHYQNRHSNDPKRHPCPTCGKVLMSLTGMKKHLIIHTGEKPHKCDVCHKAFSGKGDLQKHYRIHTGEKPYSCSICQRRFAESSTRNAHQKIHKRSEESAVAPVLKDKPVEDNTTITREEETQSAPRPIMLLNANFTAEEPTYFWNFSEQQLQPQQQKLSHAHQQQLPLKLHVQQQQPQHEQLREEQQKQLCISSLQTDPDSDQQHCQMEQQLNTPQPTVADVIFSPSVSDDASSVATIQHWGNNAIFEIRSAPTGDNHVYELHITAMEPQTYNETESGESVSQYSSNIVLNAEEAVQDEKCIDSAPDSTAAYVNDASPQSGDSRNQTSVHSDAHVTSENRDIVAEAFVESIMELSTRALHSNIPKNVTSVQITDEQQLLQLGVSLPNSEQHSQNATYVDNSIADFSHNSQHSDPSNNNPEYYQSSTVENVGASNLNQDSSLFIDTSTLPKILSEKIRYKCGVCEKFFNSELTLRKHVTRHVNQQKKRPESTKPLECLVCGLTFSYRVTLRTHTRDNHGNKFPCATCGKVFERMAKLRTHLRVHTGEKPFKCSLCARNYSQKNDLDRHFCPKTKERKTVHPCHVCGATLASSSSLKKHLVVHTGVRAFLCSICSKKFSAKGDLQKHMRIHTGEKPYRCDVCDRSFAESSTRNAHKKLHTGVRPHSCTFCGKTFIRSGDLNRHTRTHTHEKPFSCSRCYKNFTDSSALVKHKNKYYDERTGDLLCFPGMAEEEGKVHYDHNDHSEIVFQLV